MAVVEKGEKMSAKEMLEKVQEMKESLIFNGFTKTKEIDEFFDEHWMQILDMLDDALYAYINGTSLS